MSKYMWSDLTPTEMLALKGLGAEQGIWISPVVVKALGGDGNAAIMLHQLIWWSQCDMAKERQGEFYLTNQKLHAQTGINSHAQKRIRQKFQDMGLMTVRKVGIPARNYYRMDLENIIKLVCDEYEAENHKSEPSVPSSGNESAPLVSTKRPHIVNNRVNNRENNSYNNVSSGRYAKKDPVHLLAPEKIEDSLAWIMKTYPITATGQGVSEEQARRALKKHGEVPWDADEEARKVKFQELKSFIAAIKNIRLAVDGGHYETKYVPRFQNFAGTAIMYGRDPYYTAWVNWTQPEAKKPDLVV